MPYNFNKVEPEDLESMSSQDWRIARRFNVFVLLVGLAIISSGVSESIQKNCSVVPGLLFGLAWVAFFCLNIVRATKWMRWAKRNESGPEKSATR